MVGSVLPVLKSRNLPWNKILYYVGELGWCRMGVVLVVEDDEQVRVLAESIIEETGHETLTAANVEEALALIDGDQPIDLLFADVELWGNGHGGIELAQQAVEKRPNLKVLYTTGAGVTDGMRALFVEESLFLPKPYKPDALIQIVNEQLGKA
jgi:DNA-binding NtrC family response regulator